MKNSSILIDEKELLTALKNGNKKRYKQLYQDHYQMAFSFIIKNNGTPEDAEDVFQEALIALIENIKNPEFKLTSKLSTYLYSIIRQMWLYKLRSKRSGMQIIETEKEFIDITADEINEKKVIEKKHLLIEDSFQSLGEVCRQLIIDYYYKKLKLKDIGKTMNYTESFVRVKKNRCMNNLIKIIKEHPDYKSIKS